MKEYIRVAVHFVYWFESEGNSLPIAGGVPGTL